VLVLLIAGLAGAALFLAAVSSLAASSPDAAMLAGMAALFAAAVVAEAFPVPIEGVAAGRTSLATIFIVGAAVIYGWEAATILGFATMATIETGRRRPADRIAFNTSLYTLAGAAAGAAAATVRGDDLLSVALGAVIGATAFYVVDVALLAVVTATAAGRPLMRSFARSMVSTAVPFAIMASLTLILVVLWQRSPFVAVALVGPLVVTALYQRRVHEVLDRLRELDRMKNEFIAVVSHELRTPLASVYGAAMTLQRPELTPEARDSLLSVVYRESARLAGLVEQVLWASRLESGPAATSIESCDPVGLTREVIDAARARAGPGVALELRTEPALPAVAADREQVKQVLVNLIDNAVKYSPDGGRIEVGLKRLNARVRFAVVDHGLGIPSNELERVFEKFHRLDPEMSRGVGGTGLGLYISRQLVEQMNGRIWVTSREGAGSTFSFELPVAKHGD
jgi:signal transduction histidine kinase